MLAAIINHAASGSSSGGIRLMPAMLPRKAARGKPYGCPANK
jgi:hypothetical protein